MGPKKICAAGPQSRGKGKTPFTVLGGGLLFNKWACFHSTVASVQKSGLLVRRQHHEQLLICDSALHCDGHFQGCATVRVYCYPISASAHTGVTLNLAASCVAEQPVNAVKNGTEMGSACWKSTAA